MIHFLRSSSLPHPTPITPITSQLSQSFGFLRKSSFGRRAKTAAPSPLHQTALKSTNRLSRPNVIKSEPGSGTVSVPVLSAPREQSSSSASSSLGETFTAIQPAPAGSSGTAPLWRAGPARPCSRWLSGRGRGRLSVGSLHRAHCELGSIQTAGHDKVDYHEALGSLGLQSKSSSRRIIISHKLTVLWRHMNHRPSILIFLIRCIILRLHLCRSDLFEQDACINHQFSES